MSQVIDFNVGVDFSARAFAGRTRSHSVDARMIVRHGRARLSPNKQLSSAVIRLATSNRTAWSRTVDRQHPGDHIVSKHAQFEDANLTATEAAYPAAATPTSLAEAAPFDLPVAAEDV